MSPDAYEALRSAVNFARYEGCRSVASLRLRLERHYSPEVTDEAIMAWANYEASKGLAALQESRDV